MLHLPDEEPIDQPIAMLPTLAAIVDDSVQNAQEHYATLCQARSKPHVLDDATLARSRRVYEEEREWAAVYERQIPRWRNQRLSVAQRDQVDRLADEVAASRAIAEMILGLIAELEPGTIDAIGGTDDAQLGLEVLLGRRPSP